MSRGGGMEESLRSIKLSLWSFFQREPRRTFAPSFYYSPTIWEDVFSLTGENGDEKGLGEMEAGDIGIHHLKIFPQNVHAALF